MNPPVLPWWSRSVHEDRRPFLLARNAIAEAVRGYFAAEGFLEVDPAILQVSPANETHIHGLATRVRDPAGEERLRYLHASPEFAMKKLLAAGETRLFSLGHVFRDRERGPLHATEFSMIEWYRADEPYEAVMADCVALLCRAAAAAGRNTLTYRATSIDPSREPERVSVADAFSRHAGIDLLSTIDEQGNGVRDHLARIAEAAGIASGRDDTWSDIFSRILVAKVEPNLGNAAVTILDRYPATEAALARLSPDDRRVAERFEVYACGIELSNGFGELTDAAEQRRRFEADMDEKHRIYGERYPLDEELLAALESMPKASGCAMGFDRVVMLATGAARIDQVQWTPASWGAT